MIQTSTLYGPTLCLTPFRTPGPALRFALNRRDNHSQVGILLITELDPQSAQALLELLIAVPEKRAEYGPEALDLALTFAFSARKLHRLTVRVPEFDRETIGLIEQHGFMLEACQRQALFLRGRFWDELVFGLLVTDWQDKVQYESFPLLLQGNG